MRGVSVVIVAALAAACMLTACSAAWAQATPAEAAAEAVASSGVFPPGTAVTSVSVDGESAVVDLSIEAVASGLTDGQSDDMVKAIVDALSQWEEIKSIEVTAAGAPLWQYLPLSSAPADGNIGAMSASMAVLSEEAAPAMTTAGVTTSELAGKKIALHPSHGTYLSDSRTYWMRAQRTLTGPNPATRIPPGWTGSRYTPSDYYYWTKKFQWGSFYEDDMSPETIVLLKKYLEAAGAAVFVSREMDKNAANFVPQDYGYPAASFSTPMWQMASMYYLRSQGLPQWIWDEPTLSKDYDKDIRSRPYYANYVNADLSLSLHSNAASVGNARGTETYWYTSMYPWLQAQSTQFATLIQNSVITTMSSYFDDGYGRAMYPKVTPNPPEWPSGTYPGYLSWANRGVKTTNFGEIREAKMPSCLCEVAFHDDWKFFPDNLFMQDKIWRASIAWGFYNAICTFFNATPKTRLSATAVSSSFPSVVGPGKEFTGSVTMRNNGMIWCWGNKWVSTVYQPYTVWYLKATGGSDPFTPTNMIPVDANDTIAPGETETFSIAMTSPTAEGLYTTSWQMIKNDAKGGAFGDTVAAQIRVDATPPVITINSPAAADYPYGPVTMQFDAADDYSGIASISADIDGQSVTDGETINGLTLGSHTLTVTATDGVGNSSTKSAAFNIINTPGIITVGGWIELQNKKGTCGFNAQYTNGDAAPTGSVTYQDHDTGMTVKSTAIVAVGIAGSRANIYGNCTIDGEAGHWFRINVVDNGEPGSSDTFCITLDTEYTAGGTLGGGNVTVH